MNCIGYTKIPINSWRIGRCISIRFGNIDLKIENNFKKLQLKHQKEVTKNRKKSPSKL